MKLCALLACVLSTCAGQRTIRGSHDASVAKIKVSELVTEISNADVDWEFQWIGMMATRVRGASLLVGKHFKRTMIPGLVVALDDPQRCASAHYVLGRMFHVPIHTEGGYDGLQFDRKMKPIVDERARMRLKRIWKERLCRLEMIEAIPP
jgi:hypothetical protein